MTPGTDAVTGGRPLVSVVVPTRDAARTVARCLASVRAQTWPALELLVVDNWSRDGTWEVAARLADVALRAGHERSAQRNLGIERAAGEWVLWVDADMVLATDAVERALAAARATASDRSTASGARTMSASTHSTHSPAARSIPRLRWALRSGPARRATSARRAATSQVPSRLQLSTTSSSSAGQVWDRTEARQRATVRAASRVGTTTDTSGRPPFTAPARRRAGRDAAGPAPARGGPGGRRGGPPVH